MPVKQLPVSRTGKPNPIDIHVGRRVRLCRTLVGLSQEELGEAVGLTFQQIQKYERGTNRISASRLYAFSHVLDMPVPYFFEDMPPEISGKGGKPVSGLTEEIKKETSPGQFTKRETLELVRAYYRIKDPNVRKRLFGLVNSLAGA